MCYEIRIYKAIRFFFNVIYILINYDYNLITEVLVMAKTIKFNLLCNGKSIRNLDDFRNNFNVEDVLRYYNNGILIKWLEVRGYLKELEDVTKIDTNNISDLILSLAKIFEVTDDYDKIKENLYIYTYENELKKLIREQYAVSKEYNDIIKYYHNKYNELIDEIIHNPNDKSIIKSSVAILVNDYIRLLEIDAKRVFDLLLKQAPLAIYTMLTHDYARRVFLGNEYFKEQLSNNVNSLSARKMLVSQTNDSIKLFQNITDYYWKDLVERNTKVLIIYMGKGTFVRSSGKIGEEITAEEAMKNFSILNGLDYKNNNIENELLYMEV